MDLNWFFWMLTLKLNANFYLFKKCKEHFERTDKNLEEPVKRGVQYCRKEEKWIENVCVCVCMCHNV